MINEIQNAKIGNNSLPAQRQTVLDALEKAPRTTIELREQFDIISPPARIFELKARGYNIVKESIEATTAQNRKHKNIARYFLISEGK
jgi:Helix-turn-helix domain